MKTKAAILWELNKPLVIDDVQIPALKRGQILVKVIYSGVCRAQWNEMIGLKGPDKFLPHLLGHEATGTVVDCGEGITKVKPGDYVCLSWIKGSGLDGINSQYLLNGRVINAGGVTTFSDYTVVSENRVTPIPKSVDEKAGAILGCAVLTGGGIVENTLKAVEGRGLAVFGVGGVGLSAILAAHRKKLNPIIAVDVDQSRLSFAMTLGATHAMMANSPSLMSDILTLSPKGLDYAVDASGHKSAMESAFSAVKEGGGLCVIAGNLGKDEKISIHPFDLIKGKRLAGTWGGESFPDQDIPKFASYLCDGSMPFDRMITHCFELETINQAFDTLSKGEAGRIVVRMAYE